MLAALFAACPSGTETNTASNTVEKPKTVEATVLEVDDTFSAAGEKKDGKFFDTNLTGNFVGVSPTGLWDKAMIVKMIGDDKCENKPNPATDRKVVELGDGTALLTGKGSGERTCDGKTTKSSENYAVLFVKDGETWKAAYYQTIPTSTPEAAKADDAKKEGDKSVAESEAKKEEPAAKEEKPAAEAKKEEAPAAPSIQSDETMAKTLLETEKKLWEAWSKGDTKPFEELLAANFMSYAVDGVGDRASEIKAIGEGDCKVSSYSLADGKAVKINDGLYIFTYKGNQEGTCGGKALDKVVYTTTIFTKDGDTWKPLFHMNTPAGKM